MENTKIKDIKKCHNCNNTSFIIDFETTCDNCGLILQYPPEYSTISYSEPIESKKHVYNTQTNKILKMQEWYMYTKDEKNEYKLNKYTEELCKKLQIHENLIPCISVFVCEVMNAIKKNNEGPKRSKVKDGLIIVCIYYISKNYNHNYSYIELSKKINLEMKYISKADKIIIELINCNKLQLSNDLKKSLKETEKSINYITRIITKYNLQIDPDILSQVNLLIDICNDNDILLDCTPLTIGVSCFFYIININDIDINLKIFSEIYDISMSSILKTNSKLNTYSSNFEKLNIIKIKK